MKSLIIILSTLLVASCSMPKHLPSKMTSKPNNTGLSEGVYIQTKDVK